MALNTYFQSSKKILITPVAALQHQAPITFYVPGSDSLWMDLFNSFFEFRVKILKADNSDIAVVGTDDVGPINNTMHSMFSTVDIELGGKPVSDQNSLYPYRAYLDTILLNSKDALESKGQMALYVADTAGKMSEFSAKDDGANKGLVKRRGFFKVGDSLTLIGKPITDVFQMDSPIIAGVSLKMKLTPSKDSFVLVCPAGADQAFKLKIEDARFHLKMLEATPGFALESEKKLQSETYKYFFTRKTMKHFSIPTGQTTTLIDNVYLGERPDRIFMVMVSDASMSGGYQQNPLNFIHSKLDNLSLSFDGIPIMDSPYKPDFSKRQYINLYNGLCETLGILNNPNKGLAFDRSDYEGGYTIIAFDLTADNNLAVRDAPRNGTIRLEIKFAEATTFTINIILLAEYNASLEVDKYRNIITNFP